VTRYLENDRVEILFPNSNLIRRQKDKTWIAFNYEGKKTLIDSSAGSAAVTEACSLLSQYRPENKRRVFEREDATYFIVDKNHTLAEFHEGTKIGVSPKSNEPRFDGESSTIVFPSSYIARIEKAGMATVIQGSENCESQVILPNSVRITRGSKGTKKKEDSYIFLEKTGLSLEVDTLGYLTVNHLDPYDPTEKLRTLFKLNWIEGNFESMDYSGTTFKIDRTGNPEV
jgi:hypothetical protein